MVTTKILLVSNDLETSQLWAYGLQQKDIEVVLAETADEALQAWEQDSYDLVLINSYDDNLDGVDLCRRLRAEALNSILSFAHEYDERQVLQAYEAGIDEFIHKPIGLRLFQAKVQSWLRQAWTVSVDTLDLLHAGEFRLDPETRRLTKPDGKRARLTNLEFRLMHLLMVHQGQVLATNFIVERVWGRAGHGDSVLLKNVVYRLRRKIEPDPTHPRYLQTVPDEGYVFLPHQETKARGES